MKITNLVFWALLTVGTVFQAVTLPYSPAHCQDEVQINELSRRLYETTDWTMYWLPIEGANEINLTTRLSGIPFQELGYRMFGHVGPRVFPLIWLVLMTIVCRFYFSRRTGSEWLGVVFAMLMFAFPDLVRSVHDARLESMSFLWLFAAVSVFYVKGAERHPCRTLTLAGVCSVLCERTWATSPVLMPIVIWEAWEYYKRCGFSIQAIVRPILIATLVAGCVYSIFRIPSLVHYDLLAAVGRYMIAKHLGLRGLQWKMLWNELTVLPFAYALGIWCIFSCRRFLILSLGCLGFMGVCLLTYTYGFRTIYFAPYATIGMAMASVSYSRSWSRRLMVVLACGMAFFAYGRSVVARNVLEYLAKDARDESFLEKTLEHEIGRDAAVYSETLQTYYAGRELGWKQYLVFSQFSESPKPIPEELLRKVDYFICESNFLKTATKTRLENFGFRFYKEIPAQVVPSGPACEFLRRHNRVLPYGPYCVYKRMPIND